MSSKVQRAIDELATGKRPFRALRQIVKVFSERKTELVQQLQEETAARFLASEQATVELVKAVRGSDEDEIYMGLLVFGYVAPFAEFAKANASEDLVATLFTSINSTVPSIPNAAALALMNLSISAHGAKVVSQAGGIEKVVQLLKKPGTNEDLWGCLAGALSKLTTNSINRSRRAAAAGAVPVLARVTLSQSPMAQEEAAAALMGICSAAACTSYLTDDEAKGAIAALARMLVRGVTPECQAAAAMALVSVYQTGMTAKGSSGNELRHVLAKAVTKAPGALKVLACQMRDAKHVPAATTLLAAVLHTETSAAAAAIEAGAAEAATALRNHPQPEVRGNAELLLMRLGLLADDESRERLDDLAATGTFESLLKSMCANCATEEGRLNECSRCGKVAYCSARCQKLHWKVHKDECSKADVMTSRSVPTAKIMI